jgi:hypothetical protein
VDVPVDAVLDGLGLRHGLEDERLERHAGHIPEPRPGDVVGEVGGMGGDPWTVLLDHEGGEFCALVSEEPLPAYRMYEVGEAGSA